jgi:hypothetical protein
MDSVVRHRDRAARPFDYRIEILVTAAKRKWGYYVLPFLLGEHLVARADLKSDRAAGSLRVLGSYLEPTAKARAVAPPLAKEPRTMAAWLGLDSVRIERKGDFADALASVLRG